MYTALCKFHLAIKSINLYNRYKSENPNKHCNHLHTKNIFNHPQNTLEDIFPHTFYQVKAKSLQYIAHNHLNYYKFRSFVSIFSINLLNQYSCETAMNHNFLHTGLQVYLNSISFHILDILLLLSMFYNNQYILLHILHNFQCSPMDILNHKYYLAKASTPICILSKYYWNILNSMECIKIGSQYKILNFKDRILNHILKGILARHNKFHSMSKFHAKYSFKDYFSKIDKLFLLN